MRFLAASLLLIAPLVAAEKMQVSGTVRLGPEAMYFQQCNSEEKWWLDSYSFNSQGWPTVKEALEAQPECSLETMPCTHQTVAVSGTASVTGKGEYGHLGMYPRQVTFTKVALSGLGESCGV